MKYNNPLGEQSHMRLELEEHEGTIEDFNEEARENPLPLYSPRRGADSLTLLRCHVLPLSVRQTNGQRRRQVRGARRREREEDVRGCRRRSWRNIDC